MDEMGDRPQRSDAARNRQRLLEAAADVFAAQGLDAGVGEIAARAGVGRGTLFRNFPTKQDLIAAIVVDRMRSAIEDGRALLASGTDPGEMPFAFLEDVVSRQQADRALFQAVSDEFLGNAEIHAVHEEFIELIDALLERGKKAGSVRPEVGAMDVMLLVKGVCSAAAAVDAGPELLERHLDLIRAAISAPGHEVRLRGQAPTLADLRPPAAAAPAGERRAASGRGPARAAAGR